MSDILVLWGALWITVMLITIILYTKEKNEDKKVKSKDCDGCFGAANGDCDYCIVGNTNGLRARNNKKREEK